MVEPPVEDRVFLVYADDGMTLVYAGVDASACEEACAHLSAANAGHVSGYQFVGRQRYEVRAYLKQAPSDLFMALRRRRDLFDFSWHPGS